jgi:hypothetical protein
MEITENIELDLTSLLGLQTPARKLKGGDFERAHTHGSVYAPFRCSLGSDDKDEQAMRASQAFLLGQNLITENE